MALVYGEEGEAVQVLRGEGGMKDRPITMSAPMVRAILEGRKTQTRRVFKGCAPPDCPGQHSCKVEDGFAKFHLDGKLAMHSGEWTRCPYGKVTDRLYVKEAFWHDIREPNECVIYAESPGRHKYRTRGIVEPCEAGLTEAYLQRHEFWKKCSSICMPRWASRITLEITSVRVERVQEISEEDAKAEGSYLDRCACLPKSADKSPMDRLFKMQACHIHGEEFSYLWNSINGKTHPWKSNCWVWVIEFRKL